MNRKLIPFTPAFARAIPQGQSYDDMSNEYVSTLTRAQKLKLTREAFDRLHVLNNISWSSHQEKLLDLCSEEERGHRGFAPDFAKHHHGAASVRDCARVFAVKRIAEYLSGHRMPRGKDYLHYQKSCFYAAGLVHEFRKEIRKAWRGLDVKALTELDYSEFVRVKEAA